MLETTQSAAVTSHHHPSAPDPTGMLELWHMLQKQTKIYVLTTYKM